MSNNLNREFDSGVDQIEKNLESLRREDDLQTSASLRVTLYLLEESILNQFEVLRHLKNKRTRGPIKQEDIEDAIPKLRLSGKIIEDIITKYLTHDAEEHVEVADD